MAGGWVVIPILLITVGVIVVSVVIPVLFVKKAKVWLPPGVTTRPPGTTTTGGSGSSTTSSSSSQGTTAPPTGNIVRTAIIFTTVYRAPSIFEAYDPEVTIDQEGTVLQVIQRAEDTTFGSNFLQVRRCGQALNPQRPEWVLEDDVNPVNAPCP